MAEPRIRAIADSNAVDAYPGVTRRTLASGDRLTLMRIEVAGGATVPEHKHMHEQAGTVVSGRISIRLGDVTTVCGAGDAYLIPGDLPHEVVAIEDSVLVEAFSPVREEYANG